MKKEKETLALTEVDILGSIEFDLNEAIKDLIYNIKTIKNDLEIVKKQVKRQNK